MNRLLYNRAIINKLSELVEKHPYLRFGQLLVDCGIITFTSSNYYIIPVDPFYEESETTWKRMTENKICFN